MAKVTELIDDIQAALATFTGREVSLLSEVKARFRSRPDFETSIIALAASDDPMISRAAMWIILESVREGAFPVHRISVALQPHLQALSDWQAVLCLLQAFEQPSQPIDHAESYADFAEANLRHRRPFLRAWSMNTMCRLAHFHPELAARAQKAHQNALNDPAASVRARARNITPPALNA